MRILILSGIFFLLLAFTTNAQQYPTNIGKAVYFAKTPPLREMTAIPPVKAEDTDEIPELIISPHNILPSETGLTNKDSVLQLDMGTKKAAGISVNVEGMWNYQNKIPPDTDGDVGPDHYVQMVNMSFAVFDKEGNMEYGPVANITIWQDAPEIWSGFSNGDPIVLYDETADRWLISELSFPYHPYSPHYIKIAISETSDPTGSWYLYGFEYDYFCDYPKFGIWNDGYYLTTNNNYWDGSQWRFHAVGVTVFERSSMLTGSEDARRIFFDLSPNDEPWSMLVADFDGEPPPTGSPCYLAYYKEAYPDRIGIYSLTTNWLNPENSTLELTETLIPEPFSGSIPAGVPQPDGAPYLSAMSNRLLYRLQYRNFGDYQSMVTNHTINKGNGVAAIRWYEFRNYDNSWQIYQQGTYSPDNDSRWLGSVAMDEYGNIALGYSVSGFNTYPSIRFTGRLKVDPLGLMTIQETEIVAGSGVQLSPYHRWGDYSCMSLDPVNQISFWYTQEYYEVTGDKSWQTRITEFNLIDQLILSVNAENNNICEGDSTQLLAVANGGSSNYTYSWISNPSGFFSNEQNPLVWPDTNTLYICTISDYVNVLSDSVNIFVENNPTVFAGKDTIIEAGQSYYLLEATAQNFSALNWNSNGDGSFDNSSLLNPIYSPGETDILNAQVNLILKANPVFYCNSKSDTMLLEINSGVGIIQGKTENSYVSIMPNPSNGKFKLHLKGFEDEEVGFTIRDISGKIVYANVFSSKASSNSKIEMNAPKAGIYFAIITSKEKIIVVKLLIM